MVLFIDLVRKYSFRAFSQYINEISKIVGKALSDQVTEVIDDDLRATGALSVERVGHADNLTMGYLLPKNQVAKVMSEGSQDANLKLWLYGNDVNSPFIKDRSGWDKVVTRVGNPCVIKAATINNFAGRGLGAQFDGLADGLNMADDADFQVQSNTSGLSFSEWLYPVNDQPYVGANPYAIWTNGTTDLLLVPNRTAINNFTDFTISFWFYPITTNAGSTPNIVIKNYPSNNSFILYYTTNSFILNFRTVNNTGVGVTAGTYTLTPNKWYHVVLRFTQSTGLMEMIIDNFATSYTVGRNTGCVNIGTVADLKFDGNASFKCQSVYDEIRIWRRAITDEEVGLVYNGIDISGTPATNTEVHHAFTEGSGTSSVDEYSTATISITGTWVDPAAYVNPNGQAGHYRPRRFATIYAKRDDANNHIVAYLNSIDKTLGIQSKKGGTLSYKKSTDEAVLWLDGVNDYIALGTQSDLWSSTTKTAFSFSFWFNPAIHGYGNYRDLFSFGWGGNHSLTLYETSSGSTNISLEVSTTWPTRLGTATSNLLSAMNSWYHVVGIVDVNATQPVKLYINGTLAVTITGSPTGNPLSVSYSALLAGSANDLCGFIKDFRWWNRAITAADVAVLYAGTENDLLLPDYWLKLDEGSGTTVNDCIGRKTATITNAAPDWYQNPEVQVIDLDGIDDYIDCGNQATLWSQSLTKFSASFWFKSDGYDSVNNHYILNHGAFVAQSFYVYLDGPSVANRMVFTVRSIANSPISSTITNASVHNGLWHHCVIVYDNSLGSNNARIYLDNIAGSTGANLTDAINVSATLGFGQNAGGGGQASFDGQVADLRFWKAKALTGTEVGKLFNGTDTYDMKPDYWIPLTKGSGNPIDTIAKLTATLTNGATWVQVEPTSPARYPATLLTIRVPPRFRQGYSLSKWTYIVLSWDFTTNTWIFYSAGNRRAVQNTGCHRYEPTDALSHFDWSGPTAGTPASIYSNLAFRNLKFFKNKQLTKVEINNEQYNKFSISNLKPTEIPLVGFSTVSP